MIQNYLTSIDETAVYQLAELFRVLGDAGRVRIISSLISGEKNVGALAEAVGLSESAVSYHLRHLRQMRLVSARKDGRFVYYTLDDAHVGNLFRCGLEHVQHG